MRTMGTAKVRVAAGLAAALFLCGLPAAARAAEGPTTLRMKWRPGRTYLSRLNTTQSTVVETPFLPEPMESETVMSMDMAVSVSKDPSDDHTVLRTDFLSARMNVTGQGMALSFDSDTDPDADIGNPLAPAMRGLVASDLSWHLDADGKVREVTGLEELAAGVEEESSGLPAQASADAMMKQFSEAFKGSMETDWLPKTPVSVGDTWDFSSKVKLPDMGYLEVRMKFKLKAWEQHRGRTCAVIDATGTISSEPQEARPDGMTIEMENGKISGRVWFDPKLGMVVDTLQKSDLDVKTTMPGPGGTPVTVMTKLIQQDAAKLLKVSATKE